MSETIAYQPGSRNVPRQVAVGPIVEPSQEPSSMTEEPRPDAQSTTRHHARYYFSSGDRPLEGYTIKRAIGRGGFGEVYYAVSDAGKDVALKLLTRNIEVEKRGVQQCMNLKSPHLVSIFDMKTTDEGDTFVVMEYVSGRSLEQILGDYPNGLPLHEVRTWTRGLVQGVADLHDHGIVHRDLKPANLFLEAGVVKIGDYGLSKFIASSHDVGHSASVGTCHYMAPEISTGKYKKPIDIYAVGVIIYEMITGRVPFDGETPHEVLMKHLTAIADVSMLPEPYRTIVSKSLSKDPERRPKSVYDLLGGDAPKMPAVRFIGDGATSPTHVMGPAGGMTIETTEDEPNAPDSEVLHISDEEPVYYIGPNTMPPKRPRGRRFFGGRSQGQHRQRRRRTNRDAGSSRNQPVRPPEPPSVRIRVAEAATSLLLAFPLTILFGLPLSAAVGLPPDEAPELAAMLIGSALFGTAGVLVPVKFWEFQAISGSTRRMTLGGVGILLGTLIATLLSWVDLSPGDSEFLLVGGEVAETWTRWSGLELNRLATIALPAYFGILFATGPWSSMVNRLRSQRLRVWPIIWTGVLGFLGTLVIPTKPTWSLAAIILMSVVLQLVSPRYNKRSSSGTRARRVQAV